jgi:ppGpp synthetase/RelA/SpoT-type nucleotidyltranferase
MGTAPRDQKAFLEKYRITQEQFEKTELVWKDLCDVAADHTARLPGLQGTAQSVAHRLQLLPQVHSLKSRIKDPEHLVEKIIRKKRERPDKSETCENYREWITDLIGIRALHLFKDDWLPIHECVMATWTTHETPKAYVRAGDPSEIIEAFEKHGCVKEEHKAGYRSVHYILESSPTKDKHLVELQVRTLFEEGWSEIDHRTRYPRLSDDPTIAQCLTIFNRLAGSADEMGTFIQRLSVYVSEQSAAIAAKEQELGRKIEALKIQKSEKEALQAQVAELKRAVERQTSGLFPSLSMPSAPTLVHSGGLPLGATGPVAGIFAKCSSCGKPFAKSFSIFSEPGADLCMACRSRSA